MLAKIINNNLIEIYDTTQFDIDAIMHSGQVFRYFPTPNGYQLVAGNNYAAIEKGSVVKINCDSAEYFWRYFDLNTDYNEIKTQLKAFPSYQSAIQAGGGIRILRADFFEMVISFIISANNNIKRFTKTLNQIAERYGTLLDCGLHSFPTLCQLSRATESDFKEMGAGYRAAYLVQAVQQLSSLNTAQLFSLSAKEQEAELCKIMGVGKKVSSCIRLFAGDIHDLSVCPIDTWLKKALAKIPEHDHAALLNHPYAGVTQQYIFYHHQYLKQGE